MSTREEALEEMTDAGPAPANDEQPTSADAPPSGSAETDKELASPPVEAAEAEAPAPVDAPEAEVIEDATGAGDEPAAAVAGDEPAAADAPASIEEPATADEAATVAAQLQAEAEVAAPAEAPAPAPTETPVPAAEASVDVVEETDEDEEDEDDDAGSSFFFAPGDWYVVHTYAGYENKVKANLASRIQSMNMEDKIFEVIVPTEDVMELKAGKMQSVQKKVFPGYILVRMDLDDDSWYVVRNTPGVTGFVGSGAKPTPLDPHEVQNILQPATEERLRPRLEFEVGEVVSVVGGAFNGYSGPVSAIDVDKQRVSVLLDLFGRETPVELTFDQVTKL